MAVFTAIGTMLGSTVAASAGAGIGAFGTGVAATAATAAAARKLITIVPIDAISATYPYEEQYAVWHLANSPGTRRSTILTKVSMIIT